MGSPPQLLLIKVFFQEESYVEVKLYVFLTVTQGGSEK